MSTKQISSAYLELTELKNGDIVLRRTDNQGEPMVLIRFSKESAAYMQGIQMEIARHMVQAGIYAFSQIQEKGKEKEKAKNKTAEGVIFVDSDNSEQEDGTFTVH